MDFSGHEALITHLYEGVYVVDRDRKIIYWNEGSERITGYKKEEVVNRHCFDNILQHVDYQGKQLCFGGCPLHNTIQTGITNESHVFLRHKEGYRIPVSVKAIPIYDKDNKITGAIEVFTDERFQREIFNENERLKNELMKDPLTEIANRRYFEFKLKHIFEEAKLFNKPFGMLMFDIDHFKAVNDTHGHLIGDEILRIVAKTLTSNLGENDVISRWGGEEFIGIFKADNEDELKDIAEKMRQLISNSTYKKSDGEILKVTISIGGTIYKSDDLSSEIIKRSDDLLYQSKKNGRNQSTIA